MILTVTLNPCVDQTLYIDGLKPFDTNRVLRLETDAGGKGTNLARVLAELGTHAVTTGFIGGLPGATVLQVLDEQGVERDFVHIRRDTRTNYNIEDGSDNPPTTFNAMGPAIEPEQWDELLVTIRRWCEKAAWVTLGGSLPQGLPVDAYKLIGIIAKSAGAKLALDADGEVMRRGLEAKPHLIKPNAKEAGRLLNRKVESIDDAIFAAEQLLQYLEDDGICIVSLGADGAVMASSSGTFIGKKIEVEAVSSIGSGDSLVAGFLHALEQGSNPQDALRTGLAAGAATAMTSGVEIARKPIVDDLLKRATVERVH